MFQSPPRGTKDTNYNDDAFGFIFLGGSAAAQDPVFGAVFLTLSAAAAIGTKLQRLPPTNQVPAAVAGCTLLVVPLLSAVLPETLLSAVLPETIPVVVAPNARYIELAFCSVSMLYGFVISPTLEENES